MADIYLSLEVNSHIHVHLAIVFAGVSALKDIVRKEAFHDNASLF